MAKIWTGGSVVAVYDARGRLVKAYALTDLFARSEIDAAPHTVSSIAWHLGPVYVNRDQRTLYMMISSRSSNGGLKWVPYKEAVPER